MLDRLVASVQTLIEPQGYECLEVEWVPGSKILRIFIDSPGGIHFGDCKIVTEVLRDVFADDSELPEDYQFEVSSPGVERPVRTKVHFEKYIGKVVKVNLSRGVGGRKKAMGKVLKVDDESRVTIGVSEDIWEFPLAALDRAHLVFDWSR